ncbi:MAG TPA: hypothetical protein VE992_04420 [Solirubrobacteraceae bacterium]|nr:hypothetical protein [Solirubrobacteraceae bacterium]
MTRERPIEPAPPPDEEPLIMFLERDQLTSDRARPVPRATLSRRAEVALWALRIFGIVVSALVIYTFVAQLNS